MSVLTFTIQIVGVTYDIKEGSFDFNPQVEQRSKLTFTVLDPTNVFSFQKGQQVTLTDSASTIKFTGTVSTALRYRIGTGTMMHHDIVCDDMHQAADERTTNKIYINQNAGVIVAGMVNDTISSEGVTANYAIREDNTQVEFSQGTLNGLVATINLGGDLELASAGSQVTIFENTGSIFGQGTLVNCQVSGNTLIPIPTPTIKFVGTESLTQDGNAYAYIEILSSGSIGIISGRYLEYDIWIDPKSPEIKSGVDIICTDGTTLRDSVGGNPYPYGDDQNIPPHPKYDQQGYADGKWRHRKFLLDNLSGKTISHVDVVFEGDKGGTYTTYIKNIYETDGTSVVNTFFNGTFNVNPPRQLQNSGYSNVSISIVNTYDCYSLSQRVSPSYSIDAAKIIRNSFLNWIATNPAGTNTLMEYSIDGGNSYITCTNNAALPSLLAGLSVAGFSIQFRQTFQQTSGASPETPPVLSFMEAVINPSYTATKSDVKLSASTTGEWNAGTLTNTQVNNGVLSLLGAVRNWSGADLSGMTIFGNKGTGPGTNLNQHVNYKSFWIGMGISIEGRSRLDFLGSWQDFLLEVDLYLDVSFGINGIVYRTTGWSNWDSDYSYALQAIQGNPGSVSLQKGSNTSASSDGTRTQIVIASVPIATGGWHRLKVLVVGSNHKIYIDDVLYINQNDSTYTAAGNIGLRTSNVSSSACYHEQFNTLVVTVTGLSGTWLSARTSLTSVGTYGNSVVTWKDVSINPQSTTILVESTLNGGSTWQTCTNGGPIPNLTAGQSLSGVNLQLRVTLSTQSAAIMPQIQYLVCRVLGQFNSTGTRIAPVLSLAPALICGSATASWNVVTPPNTSFALATSLDNITYSGIFGLLGVVISGLVTQPLPILDTFATNDSPAYAHLARTGGSASTWTWDTANSRVTASGGSNDMQLYTGVWFITGYQVKKQIIIDHTKVVGGADLSNYPLLVSFIDPNLVIPSGFVQNVNGFDIIFVSPDETTQLNHQKENFIESPTEIEMYMITPTLSHTVDTIIWIYFCNPGISTTQEHVTAVWDSNYKAVWHMDEATGANQSDSTSNAVTATQHNSPLQGAGQIDGSLTFDGLTQYLSVAHGAVTDIIGDKTVEVWVNTDSFALDANGSDPRILINNINGTNVYQFVLDAAGGGTIAFAVNDSTGQHIISNQTLPTRNC